MWYLAGRARLYGCVFTANTFVDDPWLPPRCSRPSTFDRVIKYCFAEVFVNPRYSSASYLTGFLSAEDFGNYCTDERLFRFTWIGRGQAESREDGTRSISVLNDTEDFRGEEWFVGRLR